MAASPTLLIYLNSDVGMNRPYRTALPASVDTLAELCQFLTSRIPPRPGEDTVGRGYRFLYSVLGKPLWRVKECIDAGTIVLSVGPGFLPRRPASITENVVEGASPSTTAPVGGAATTNSVDVTTPDRLAATLKDGANTNGNSNDGNYGPPKKNNRNGFQLSDSPSSSPPAKTPVEDVFSNAPVQAAGRATVTAATTNFTNGPLYAAVNGAAAAGDRGRESIDVAWPPAPSVPQPSQTDERDRLVSITLNTAARGARTSSGGPIMHSTPSNSMPAADAADGDGRGTSAARLFTTPGAPSTLTTTACESEDPLRDPTLLSTPLPSVAAQQKPPAAAATVTAPYEDVPRGVVFVGHETYPLPSRPRFTPASTALQAVLPYLRPLPATSISSSLQYLLLRKWHAYQKLHSMSPADLIAGEALSQKFTVIASSCSNGNTRGDDVCRVVVSGPPRSGVSTTAAFLVRHLLRTLHFQPQNRLYNTLVVPLDFKLLFGSQATSASGLPCKAPPRMLLDLASLYQLMVRSVMDAVVAQRPSLREVGPLLSQLWDLVIKQNVEPRVAPNFTKYVQVAAYVGGDVLARWTRLAEEMFPVLQAACRTPDVPELRDAVLDLIFYAVPAEMAASLNFCGLFYAIDGAELLTQCYAHGVKRPAGDLGPLLQALTADPRTHLVLSWPSTIPPRTLFIPRIKSHVPTIGLVTRDALNRMHFPQLIRCGRKEYPIELFLGCPGYLTHLYSMVRPFRKNLTIPTTAYSAYYQRHYERPTTDGYAVRVDSSEVSSELDKLLSLVQHLPAA